MRLLNNLYRPLTFVTGLALLLMSSCSSHKKNDLADETAGAILVKVGSPSNAGTTGIHLSGQVEASQTANISTRVMGYISSLKVQVGDHVNKGQLLATISNQDMIARRGQTDAMIAEAEAAVASAKKDLDRFTILYQQQSATAKELDNVTLQYNSSKARLEGAREMRKEVNATLGYTSLVAPFSGIVTQKLADAGSMASPGMPILTIEQAGTFQVSASVPENLINQVALGAKAVVAIKSLDRTINGTVSQINPSSQFSGGQYIIKIQVAEADRKDLFAGMYANITLQPKERTATTTTVSEAVMVPLSSIEHKDQLTGLYTIGSNNTALLRWVRLGKTYGENVEVLSGLGKEESFILQADGKLYNGVPVRTK